MRLIVVRVDATAAHGDNRFALPLASMNGEEQELAAAAVQAARATFAQFGDKPDSAFYAAPGLTAKETWERVVEELARVCVVAALDGTRDVPLGVDDLELIHRGIFEPVFGSSVAGFRSSDEFVDFPIYVGTRARPELRTRHGASPKQIQKRLRHALRNFDGGLTALARQAAAQRAELRDAVEIAVKLYVRIIRIHPFMDGNGRVAWAAFGYALRRCNLPLVEISPTLDTRWALGTALRRDADQDYGPLVDIVTSTLRTSGDSQFRAG